ncbi:MAG: glycosyl hydrolase family 28-related protein [Methyloceanibacter sp.]
MTKIVWMLAAALLAFAPFTQSHAEGCAKPPSSPLVVNVTDKGAKGDGKTSDTAAIKRAIDEVGGTGGTVFVPDGTYLVTTIGKGRLALKSNMTLKLAPRATLKAIPNGAKNYSVLRISKASDATIEGGTLFGDRAEHKSKGGERGMGLHIGPDAERITVSRLTTKEMWGDGFYVSGAADVTFCFVTADHNRRQGLSIINAKRVLVTDSLFTNTRGTDPSAGIDLEPNKSEHSISNIRIENSKFINNAGGGIEIAGKRGRISDVAITRNVFRETRPILVENAPAVLSTKICDNRSIAWQNPSPEGLNTYADTVDVVSLQMDCRQQRDLRFEVKRQKNKKKED